MARSRRQTVRCDVPPPENDKDAAALPPDLSGWQAHPSERRDFYHSIRYFPPEVAAWRRELLRHVEEHPGRFPHASRDREQLAAQVDEGISFLREIARKVADKPRSAALRLARWIGSSRKSMPVRRTLGEARDR
jgi:hypothetical protein